MLDSSLKHSVGELALAEETQELQRRRRKRYHAHRQKKLDRLRKKALTAFLYVLTIALVLAAWYGLLKS